MRSNQIRSIGEMRSFYRTWGTYGAREQKKYTSKQKRKAHDIEKGYKKRGVSSKEAERRAWATVNKSDRGGRKKGGGGGGKKRSKSSSRKGGRKGRPKLERLKAPGDRVRDDASTDGDQIPANGHGNSFDLAPFLSCSLGSLFAESCARLFRQMRNRSLSLCSFGRSFNVPLRSGSLFSSCHNFT